MQPYFNISRPHLLQCKTCIFILAFSWTVSIIAGALLAARTGDAIIPIVLNAVRQQPSLEGYIFILLLPIAASAVCIGINCRRLIWFFCGIKGLTVGFCLYAVLCTFNSAGWIIWPMLTFADSVMLIPLFWFWLRSFKHNAFVFSDLILCLICAVAVGCLDCCMISPYLIEITNLL